jgi:phosphate transport system substrate-binding protein
MNPRRCPSLLVFVLLLALAGVPLRASPRPVVLNETGSTLLYPLFNLWAARYTRLVPTTRITTEGTGSGTGIAQALSGLVTLGASDAYVSDFLARQHPNLLNIPLAISSQMVNYNLPHLNARSLRLSGPVLAAIYSGRIRRWNAPAIAALNPGVPLPHHRIVVVHRSDGSGDTFLFTQYLSFTTPGWERTVGYGTTVNWPAVPGEIGATGNPGMVEALHTTPYAIAYVGVSYARAIRRERLGTARLKNRAGRFVALTPAAVEAAARALVGHTPADERLSLVDAPGADAYPIVNYEYVLVQARQPSSRVARTLRRFLDWCLSPQGGSAPAFLHAVGFVRLPRPVRLLSLHQIARIH